jgi:tRNA pseudouridine38-40 synthase
MRYFIFLSYKGTEYHGWQKQKNAITIQGMLEETLSIVLNKNVEITGAGRTDTGVHARFYAAHFDFEHEIKETKDFIYKINAILPADIAILDLKKVISTAHARYSAISRTYQYHVVTRKNPFEEDFAWKIQYPLDLDKMNDAANFLRNITDFTSFVKLHSNNNTNICNIHFAQWQQNEDKLIFSITANRFLRNMVRSIVANMIDIGRNKVELSQFQKAVLQFDRSLAANTAPAKGLFFTSLSYPDDIFIF